MVTYLVVGDTIQHGKQYIEGFNLDWNSKTTSYYTYAGLEFRFTTIQQLKNGSLKGHKKFLYSLCSKSINLGDYHEYIRPLTKKSKFTVF